MQNLWQKLYIKKVVLQDLKRFLLNQKKTAARGAKAVDEGRERKATRLLKKAARQETRSIKLEEVEKKRMKKMKKGGATKAFKVHMMYSKTGKAVKAPTMKKHLELKAKGYNHDKRRLKKKK